MQAYNGTDGKLHPAAPSPKYYGVDVSKCYVCNPDTPTATYDTGDTWFPSNSSRLIGAETAFFWSHFKANVIKPIDLPRQARDKYTKRKS